MNWWPIWWIGLGVFVSLAVFGLAIQARREREAQRRRDQLTQMQIRGIYERNGRA